MYSQYDRAQLIIAKKPAIIKSVQTKNPLKIELLSQPVWAFASLGLVIALVSFVFYNKWQYKRMKKAITRKMRF